MSEPAGIVMPFAGSVAPDGWLLCDGSAVSRDTYNALFIAIGTTYGDGDGSTTFNLPDLSGRVVLGVSQSHALGTTGGEATHVLTEQELPAHSHTVPAHGHENNITATTPELTHSVTQPAFNYSRANGNGSNHGIGSLGQNLPGSLSTATATRSASAAISDHAATACTMGGSIDECAELTLSTVGSGEAHNNVQPSVVLNYIICIGG